MSEGSRGDTGAMIDVQVQFGDMHDADQLIERICAAEKRAIDGLGVDELHIKTMTKDCGYCKADELPTMKIAGIRANIPDQTACRNHDELAEPVRIVVEEAGRRVKSWQEKILLCKRGMYIERSFAYFLDAGGMRRTTLRGRENIEKQYLIVALGDKLSLILKTLYGVGRLKEWVANGPGKLFSLVFRRLYDGISWWHRFAGYLWHMVGIVSCQYHQTLLVSSHANANGNGRSTSTD